jgi:hypothetical protein
MKQDEYISNSIMTCSIGCNDNYRAAIAISPMIAIARGKDIMDMITKLI